MAIIRFIRTTLLGGVVVILPVTLAFLLLGKALLAIQSAATPLIDKLPAKPLYPVLTGLVALLALCFVTGLLVNAWLGRAVGGFLERVLLRRIPGYMLLRSLVQRLLGRDAQSLAVALVEQNEGLAPAFIMEKHPDGRMTVFIPSCPTPALGALLILPGHKVHPIDIPMTQAVSCITSWGLGSGALLTAMKPSIAKG